MSIKVLGVRQAVNDDGDPVVVALIQWPLGYCWAMHTWGKVTPGNRRRLIANAADFYGAVGDPGLDWRSAKLARQLGSPDRAAREIKRKAAYNRRKVEERREAADRKYQPSQAWKRLW